MGVSNRACFRLGTAAARLSHSLLKSSHKTWEVLIGFPPFPASRSLSWGWLDLPALERGGADLSDGLKSQNEDFQGEGPGCSEGIAPALGSSRKSPSSLEV